MYLRKGLRILSDTDHQLWMTYLKINSHMSKLTLFLNLWAVFTSGVREPEQNSVAFRHEVLQVSCTQALCRNSGESTWKKGVCTKVPSEDGTLPGIELVHSKSFDLLEFHLIVRSQILWLVGTIDYAGRYNIYSFKCTAKTWQVYYGNKLTECVCPLP